MFYRGIKTFILGLAHFIRKIKQNCNQNITAFKNGSVNKDRKRKRNFSDNHAHNVFRLLDFLPNFPFTTSEMRYCY